MVLMNIRGRWRTMVWRRERDSNPRYSFPYTRFPGVRLQPLGHPSANEFARQNIITIGGGGNMKPIDKLTPQVIFLMIILNVGVVSYRISLASS